VLLSQASMSGELCIIDGRSERSLCGTEWSKEVAKHALAAGCTYVILEMQNTRLATRMSTDIFRQLTHVVSKQNKAACGSPT
jgi:hypothetical protein